MRILFSPEYSGAVFARANDGSGVMMDTVVLNTMGLIDMLELRLGLHYEDLPQNERLAHYYDAVCKYMTEKPENIMAASFKTSGLGTAKAMLAWRDELRKVNWDFDGEEVSERLSVLIGVEEHSMSERIYQTVITFTLVTFAWIFFRAKDLGEAFYYIERMFTKFNPWEIGRAHV